MSAVGAFYPTDLHTGNLGLGKCDDTLERLAAADASLLFVFGRQDPHIPVEGRRKIHALLEDAEADFEWHEFNAAHAFLRDEGVRYNPALARVALALLVPVSGGENRVVPAGFRLEQNQEIRSRREIASSSSRTNSQPRRTKSGGNIVIAIDRSSPREGMRRRGLAIHICPLVNHGPAKRGPGSQNRRTGISGNIKAPGNRAGFPRGVDSFLIRI